MISSAVFLTLVAISDPRWMMLISCDSPGLSSALKVVRLKNLRIAASVPAASFSLAGASAALTSSIVRGTEP